MFQIAIGVGADELAPVMFVGMGFGLDPGSGDRRFRFGSQLVPAPVTKLLVVLVLLLALRTGFHLSESIILTMLPG